MACVITAETAAAQFAKNATAIAGKIGEDLKINVPFLAVLDTGTFEASQAATLQSVVQGRAAAGDSKVQPTFTAMATLCDNSGVLVDRTGTKVYNYSVGIKQGTSDKICVNTAFSAYKDSLMGAWSSLAELVKEYIHGDVRYNLLDLSGSKYVVTNSSNYSTGLTGGYGQGGTSGAVSFATIESDAVLTQARLQRLARFLTEQGKVKKFGSGNDAYLIFIGGAAILENLRNDTSADYRALVAGQDTLGKNMLKGYKFDVLYRGIKYTTDQIPLRANWNSVTSEYDLVEPEINQDASNGREAVTNPAWETATHEIGFLIGAQSFERQTPQNWVGEGPMKFERQLFGGDLQFLSHKDMTCNLFGNFGVIGYQIGRAYRPKYPWAVMPIVYRNPDLCNSDGLVTCS